MKTRTTLALLALTLGTLPAMAQQLDANGIGRTELVRHDFDATREAIHGGSPEGGWYSGMRRACDGMAADASAKRAP